MMRQGLLRTLHRRVASKATKGEAMPSSFVMSRSVLQRKLAVSAVSVSTPSSFIFDQQSFSFSSMLAATVMAAAGAVSLMTENHKSDCCGIVGVVATKAHGDAREFLLDGLTILKNRGYDSAGIATVPADGGEMSITKYASDGDKADSIELVGRHSHSMGHTLGIAHTRWYVQKKGKPKWKKSYWGDFAHCLTIIFARQGHAWR
jgi:hypothetical protein